jgi:hypothetical protein
MTVPYEWKITVLLFMHGNIYDLDELKEATLERSEWIERVQRQFEEVLQTRPVTVGWYFEHANAGFGDEETLYRYLKEVYDYVFREGPWPVTES